VVKSKKRRFRAAKSVRCVVLALAPLSLGACGSAGKAAPGDGKDGVALLARAEEEASDPEAERQENQRIREERRRVVDATLVWIVAETAERVTGETGGGGIGPR
jgi:hypothetical protein